MNAHLTGAADMHAIVRPLFIRAIGTGFGFVPLTILGVASLPQAQRPGGTALFNLTRELGASIGTALQQRIAGQALLRAFDHNFLLLAVLFAAASWLIILMRRPKAAVDAGAAH